jgi:hypothetical protein
MNFAAWEEFDARWSARLRVAEKPGNLRTLAMVFAHSGDSWFWLLGLGLIWAFGNPAYQDLTVRTGELFTGKPTLTPSPPVTRRGRR